MGMWWTVYYDNKEFMSFTEHFLFKYIVLTESSGDSQT
jgi:hypothetical protein